MIVLDLDSLAHIWMCSLDVHIWPQGNKTVVMLSSAEYKILKAHKYKLSRNSAFSGSDKPRMLFFLLMNDKMPTIVGILTFMSRKKLAF